MALKKSVPTRQVGTEDAAVVAPPAVSRPGDGRTQPVQGEHTVDTPVPRLPHERDESDDSQVDSPATPPEPTARKAYEDASQGKQDTSYSPVTDAAYHRQRKPD